ncbi:MAG TPA: hypothetical protein VGB08_04290 [Allosphingosinicella sp.]|jgi:hypothetical protein
MRPASIVTFERLLLLMIVLGLVGAVLSWDTTAAAYAAQGLSEGVLIAAYAVALAVSLLLLWLIARRGSNVARWVYVVLCLAGLAVSLTTVGALLRQPLPALLMQAAQLLLTIFSVVLLFRADASAWFSRSGSAPAD